MLKEGRSMFIIMIITVLSKILGFVREITMASMFGTTAYTDAYLVAITIPMVIFVTFGGALSTALIPLYADIEEKRNKESAVNFANNIMNIVILFTVLLSILGIIFVKPLVRIFAMGFERETLNLTIEFTRILLPGIILIGANYILTSFLHANKEFKIPVLISIPSNIIIILCIFLSYFWNKKILIYGTLLGMLSQLLIQLIVSFKIGYRYKPSVYLKDENIIKVLYLVVPIFIGMAVKEFNILIDRTLASTLYEGSIAALNFAKKLNWFVYEVFTVSIATVIYPTLSQLAAKRDSTTLKTWMNQSINLILLIIIPISVGAMCLSTPIVRALFQRGVFDARATYLTSTALFYYSIGMIGFGINEILSKVFYALQDSKTVMKNGVLVVTINIALNLLLIRNMGHGGLALATSISSLVGAVMLFYNLRAKIGPIGGRKCLTVMVKVCISAAFMAIGVRLFYNYISELLGSGFFSEGVSLFTSVLLGGFIYFILIRLMRVEEMNYLIDVTRRKIVLYFNVLHKKASETLPATNLKSDRIKILLGIGDLKTKRAEQVVFNIITGLPEDKYDITLVTSPGKGIIQKVNRLNICRNQRIKIISLPLLKGKITLVQGIGTFLKLYSLIKKERYSTVHFHDFKIGTPGRWAAWCAGATKIFLTIHKLENQSLIKQKVFEIIERLTAKITSKIIFVSNYHMKCGIRGKWADRKKSCLIYNSVDSNYPSKGKLRKGLKIKKSRCIIGTMGSINKPNEPIFTIKVFNEVKKRGHRVKLVMIGDGPLKEKCAGLIYDLGINLDVFMINNYIDYRELITDFDVFTFFSKYQGVPYEIIDAMYAGKPIVANDAGAISELVYNGGNGYLLEEFDVKKGADCIEKLIIDYELRQKMGGISRSIAHMRFRREKMIDRYMQLYL